MEIAVVFDVNVYIDACVAIADGHPFPMGWHPAPPARPEVSLACCAAVVADLPPEVTLELFSDEALDQLVLRKLTDPVGGPNPGLGWDVQTAKDVYGLVTAELDASGRSMWIEPPAAPAGLAGADYEDQRVYGLLLATVQERPDTTVMLITNDGEFAEQVNGFAVMLPSGLPRWAAFSSKRFIDALQAVAGS